MEEGKLNGRGSVTLCGLCLYVDDKLNMEDFKTPGTTQMIPKSRLNDFQSKISITTKADN